MHRGVQRHSWQMSLDPHNGELLMFLGGLESEAEVVAPRHWRVRQPLPPRNGAWAERPESLRVKIARNDEDKLARIMRAVYDLAEDNEGAAEAAETLGI